MTWNDLPESKMKKLFKSECLDDVLLAITLFFHTYGEKECGKSFLPQRMSSGIDREQINFPVSWYKGGETYLVKLPKNYIHVGSDWIEFAPRKLIIYYNGSREILNLSNG